MDEILHDTRGLRPLLNRLLPVANKDVAAGQLPRSLRQRVGAFFESALQRLVYLEGHCCSDRQLGIETVEQSQDQGLRLYFLQRKSLLILRHNVPSYALCLPLTGRKLLDHFSDEHCSARRSRTGHTKNVCSLLSKMAGPTPRIITIPSLPPPSTHVHLQYLPTHHLPH